MRRKACCHLHKCIFSMEVFLIFLDVRYPSGLFSFRRKPHKILALIFGAMRLLCRDYSSHSGSFATNIAFGISGWLLRVNVIDFLMRGLSRGIVFNSKVNCNPADHGQSRSTLFGCSRQSRSKTCKNDHVFWVILTH